MAKATFSSQLRELGQDETCDLVVLGAGAAGLGAAAIAAAAGAKVLLVESTAWVGGTSATSAGTTWVPGSDLAPQVNAQDSLEQARRFLDLAVGERSSPKLRAAFLANGAAAVRAIQAHTHLQFRIRPFHPDYSSELEGSTVCGRALEPLPFDGRLLGADFALVRPPMPEFMVLGGMMVDRDCIPHLLNWNKSWASFKTTSGLLLAHLRDRLSHPRGTRLLMGNAWVGRLLLSAKERGVTLLMQTEATALHTAEQASAGISGSSASAGNASKTINAISLKQGDVQRTIHVRGGVVLATGGFNRHPLRRAQRLGTDAQWCAGAPGHTGSAHPLAEGVGAQYGPTGLSDAFWAPVSIQQRPDGSTATFPHFVFDRAKPHMITVDQQGQRFLNESTSYHLFGLAMRAAHQHAPSIPAFLITDAQGLHKYGLGMVRPRGMGLSHALANGYVEQAPSLDALAKALKLPAQALENTVNHFNRYAKTGVDPDFARGSTAYQKANGDATWSGPNPSLGPLEQAPFYALRLYPGDIGAATGFATDEHARALDAQQQPIAGLYAVGNDMHSIMGGTYPAPGITLGPGLVFAYLAAQHAVQRAKAAKAGNSTEAAT